MYQREWINIYIFCFELCYDDMHAQCDIKSVIKLLFNLSYSWKVIIFSIIINNYWCEFGEYALIPMKKKISADR
jgi:hypothetical protein